MNIGYALQGWGLPKYRLFGPSFEHPAARPDRARKVAQKAPNVACLIVPDSSNVTDISREERDKQNKSKFQRGEIIKRKILGLYPQ